MRAGFLTTIPDYHWLVTEKQWARDIDDALEKLRWTYYKTFLSIRSPDGYPDRTATKGSRTVWFELKRMSGKLTENQISWLDALSDNPHNECYVIRPHQLDLVIEILNSVSPYNGEERWRRDNHYGAESTSRPKK